MTTPDVLEIFAEKIKARNDQLAKDPDDYSEEEEHANSSRANYKDYMAEERATTDRGND